MIWSMYLLCRGVVRGFWAAIIWTRIGVGVGLLGELGETARRRNRNEVKRKGIDRVWRGIEGYRGMLRYRTMV